MSLQVVEQRDEDGRAHQQLEGERKDYSHDKLEWTSMCSFGDTVWRLTELRVVASVSDEGRDHSYI